MSIIDDDRAQDIIVTAVEGGINYWAAGEDYHWSDEDPGSCRVTIWDIEEPDDDAIKYHIDVPLIKRTMEKAIRGGYGKNGTHYAAEVLAENEDATTADVLVQLAIFGEIVYG